MASWLLVWMILLAGNSEIISYVSGQSVCSSVSCLDGSECVTLNPSTGTFSCRCKPGYSDGQWNFDQGTFSCQDVDECATRTHRCGVNATCENVVGSHRCLCADDRLPWTAPSGEQHCTDLGTNICSTSLSLCGSGTRCESLASVYTCTCLPGYAGQMFSQTLGRYICQDVNECVTGGHNCAEGSLCENRVGSFECRCPPSQIPWATPQGSVICAAGDICLTSLHVCGRGTDCTSDNALRRYNCSCSTGYQDWRKSEDTDNITCSDVDECANDKKAVCNVQSGTCVNSIGSYWCQCKQGFTSMAGNNQTCLDVDECSDSSLFFCPNSTICENIIGSYTCSCQAGYIKSSSGADVCEPQGEVEIGVGLAVAALIFVAVVVLVIIWFSRDRCKKKKKPDKKGTSTISAHDLTSLSTLSENSSFAMTPSALLSTSSRNGSVMRQPMSLNGIRKTQIYHVHSVTERMVRSKRRQILSRQSQASSYVSRKSSTSRISDPSNSATDNLQRPSESPAPSSFAEIHVDSVGVSKNRDYKGNGKGKGAKGKRKPGMLTLTAERLPQDEHVTVEDDIVTPLEGAFFEQGPFPEEEVDKKTFSIGDDEILYDHVQRLNIYPNTASGGSSALPQSLRSVFKSEEGPGPSMVTRDHLGTGRPGSPVPTN